MANVESHAAVLLCCVQGEGACVRALIFTRGMSRVRELADQGILTSMARIVASVSRQHEATLPVQVLEIMDLRQRATSTRATIWTPQLSQR
jgi:hypothetical protein